MSEKPAGPVERELERFSLVVSSCLLEEQSRGAAAERKRVREALLAEVERVSFALDVFGVTLPGGKVACRTADIRDMINRFLPEEG